MVDSGDTAWLLICTALVLFMTPGLAFFYGGMVRGKHVLAMLAQNFAVIAVVSIAWVLIAYTLAFSHDVGAGLLGNLHFAGFADPRGAIPGLTLSVPPLSYATFQMMFAVVTVALLTGAGADRMRFGSFLVFAAIWVTVVYAPLAHWVFSPAGWLAHRGLLDFAGGTVVEINAGASALALVLVLGRRHGWPREGMPPHSLPLTLLGAGILWFGWFGFNAGSALAAGNLARRRWSVPTWPRAAVYWAGCFSNGGSPGTPQRSVRRQERSRDWSRSRRPPVTSTASARSSSAS